MHATFEALNPEQRDAVLHVEGPLLVLAGAGSGKTRVLTTRVVRLIEEHGVDPATILAVTFTNKAAAEMRDRIRRQLGQEPAGMWVGTFHSIGARLLRRYASRLGWSPNFSIYDADQQVREVKRRLEALNLSPKRWHPKAVHSAISSAKNQLVPPEDYVVEPGDPFGRVVADVYSAYERALKEQNAFDFDDLLVRPVELFLTHDDVLARYRERFQFLLVDEYQDTNHAQYRLLSLLAGERQNLMVVGDDDQSIYRWRGADIRNILDFEAEFPAARVIRLEQNYRSTSRILEVANEIIAENRQRKGKTLRTEAGPGEPLTIVEAADERDEADWIADQIESRRAAGLESSLRDYVILYRTNAQSRALEEVFRGRDLPYQIIGGTRFYERREIMDVLAYLRLVSNPADVGAFDRIINYPRRGVGDATRTRLYSWAAERALVPLDAAARAAECEELHAAGADALVGFAAGIERFRSLACHIGVGELIGKLVAEMGIIEALEAEGPEGEDRIDNVQELIAGAHEFDARLEAGEVDDDEVVEGATPLDLFLQKIALITDVDRHDPAAVAVTLMTLHNAKGLEYPVVFISGMEDGLFPLARAYDEPDELEEERRLFYVGITRAERKLYLSHARVRRRAGDVMPGIPSSFLSPIPEEHVVREETRAVARSRRARGSRWGGTSDWGEEWGSERRRERRRERRVEPAEAYDGLVIDYSEAQDMPRFVKGERVRHPRFGPGTIRDLTGFGRELKAIVEFESVGRKKIMLQYANLQKEL